MANSETALRAWLVAHGINTSVWGAGGAKTVADLWREIQAGETRLEDDPPRRVVEVAQVIIRRDGLTLLEIEQELADGQRRQRMLPPSEKMKSGEDYAMSAVRGLEEELGIDAAAVALRPESHRLREQLLDSPSYPGLPTRYLLHEVEATVSGLPDDDFVHENAAASDPIRRHRWGWR